MLLRTYTRWPMVVATVLHVMLLVAFLSFAFSQNIGNLFMGLDGLTMVSLADQQLTYFGISPDLHSNVLQGLGNLSIPANLSVIPAYWFTIFDGGHFTPQATYVCFAVVPFITTLLAGWNYRFSRPVCFAAAWLFTLLFLPTIKNFNIYPIAFLVPHAALSLLLVVLIDIAIHRMGGSWLSTLGYMALLFVAVLAQLITNPTVFMILGPYLLITALYSFTIAPSRAVRARKLLAGSIVLAVMLALGWVEYVAGLMLNTAYSVFMPDIEQSPPPLVYLASLLFEGHSYDGYMGPPLFLAATAGAITMLYRNTNTPQRYAAWMLLAAQLLIAGLGYLSMARYIAWILPSPVYFELAFFPLYALFAVYFMVQLGQLLTRWFMPPLRRASHFGTCAVALLFVAVTIYLLIHPGKRDRTDDFKIPVASPLTQILEHDIGLRTNSQFRGRVLTIVPELGFYKQMDYAYALNTTHSNEHQSAGLWLQHIPTLHEYNQIITPDYFWLIQKFLSVPGITQIRNWTTFTRINPPILKLLGVRFILTPEETVAGATLRGILPKANEKDAPLRLFEWQGANTHGIAATAIAVADNVMATEAAMKSPGFKTSVAVITSADKQRFFADTAQLAPSKTSSIHVENGGFHITATSAGRTLLIVPIEYSDCLDIRPLSGAMPHAIRTDVALTGLLFDRTLDIKMVAKTGVFSNPRCRLNDYYAFKRLMPPQSSAVQPAAPK